MVHNTASTVQYSFLYLFLLNFLLFRREGYFLRIKLTWGESMMKGQTGCETKAPSKKKADSLQVYLSVSQLLLIHACIVLYTFSMLSSSPH